MSIMFCERHGRWDSDQHEACPFCVPNFRREIAAAINRHSKENGSNTPDWILAEYLEACLAAWDANVEKRERWYGRPHSMLANLPAPEAPTATPQVGTSSSETTSG